MTENISCGLDIPLAKLATYYIHGVSIKLQSIKLDGGLGQYVHSWSLKYCEANLAENVTSFASILTRVTLTVSMSVTLITCMGKGGGANTSTGIQLSLLPGPAGCFHSTSIWIGNKRTQSFNLFTLHNKQSCTHRKSTLTPSW